MPSSEFAPLAGPGRVASRGFARLGAAATDADTAAAAAAETAESDAADAELRRAFETGFAEGKASRDAELTVLHATVRESLEHLARFRGDLRQRYERELLQVALGVARKVVRQEVADHPERWLEMIRAAIARAVDREQVTVRVPPTLAAFLRDADPPLRTTIADVKVLEIVEDPSLPDGSCLLETRFGEVDVGLESQLDACERALLGTQR